jgi:glucose/arabinose dehydrogenase
MGWLLAPIGLLFFVVVLFGLRGSRPNFSLASDPSPTPARLYLPLVIRLATANDRIWDPRLTQRGATLIPAAVQPGQGYWRLVKGVWYAENEPPFQGQHHIFVDTRNSSGQRQTGVPIQITSLDGGDIFATLITEAKPGELYAANFPMYRLAPAYRAAPSDGSPADVVTGMGLGSIEQPDYSIHTSYGLTWQWVVAGAPTPTATPTPTASQTDSATPSPTTTGMPSATATVTPTLDATGTPTPTATPSPTPTATQGGRVWDPRLDQRGTILIEAEVQPGQGYWRLVKGQWFDKDEPPFAGKRNIFIEVLDETGARQTGISLHVTSLDGLALLAAIVSEAKPGEFYATDYPMSNIAPAYRVIPFDGTPADAVSGMGLGSITQPDAWVDTSYLFTWQWVVAATVTPTSTPTPTETPAPTPTGTATPTPTAAPSAWPDLVFTPVVTGLSAPVQITHAGDGSGRLFLVEQSGRIMIAKGGVLQPTPFLDIVSRVSCCGERGLFSVAFPPAGGAGPDHFYVNYTDRSGNTVIARYRVTANPDVADPASEQIVLAIAQPYANHNGGQLAFGPRDGYLYIGMGDGGSAGDPQNRGQDGTELLGKLLRIDVETGSPATYTIPAGNPFTQTIGYRGEIWALGLRNPWRFTFDRLTGDLYIGDVGQNQYEEVNFQAAASSGGENYGWRVMEGQHCYNAAACQTAGLTLPVAEYDHTLGCSITGGVVYRGPQFARLRGVYLYGDYCTGRIWGLRRDAGAWQSRQLAATALRIAAFGEDEAGEAYVADYATGTIHRIVDSQ